MADRAVPLKLNRWLQDPTKEKKTSRFRWSVGTPRSLSSNVLFCFKMATSTPFVVHAMQPLHGTDGLALADVEQETQGRTRRCLPLFSKQGGMGLHRIKTAFAEFESDTPELPSAKSANCSACVALLLHDERRFVRRIRRRVHLPRVVKSYRALRIYRNRD